MVPIEANNIDLGYEENIVINNISVEIPKNKITVLIGSNGCGKSTLLRSFARLLKPKNGNIMINGHDIKNTHTKKIAKELAILPQNPVISGSMKVRDLVEMGRFPYQNWRNKLTQNDNEIIDNALNSTNIKELEDRTLDSLSGGQRQRAWIAMVLAQGTDIILLDEPTTYLDITYQIEILDLLYKLNRNHGITIVMVLHDLNLSSRYADHIIALKNKKIYKQGSPENVVTKEAIKDIFEMDCEIIKDPFYKTPMYVPYSKAI